MTRLVESSRDDGEAVIVTGSSPVARFPLGAHRVTPSPIFTGHSRARPHCSSLIHSVSGILQNAPHAAARRKLALN